MNKNADAFRTISEVAEDLDLPQHVLRFWESRFSQIKPLKRAGGRRFYRPTDVQLLSTIRQLLYGEGYTIKGVQRLLREQGAKALQNGLRAPPDGAPFEADERVATWEHVPEAGMSESTVASALPRDLTPPHALREPAPVGRDGVSIEDAGRAALASALAIILECEQILEAVRLPADGAGALLR